MNHRSDYPSSLIFSAGVLVNQTGLCALVISRSLSFGRYTIEVPPQYRGDEPLFLIFDRTAADSDVSRYQILIELASAAVLDVIVVCETSVTVDIDCYLHSKAQCHHYLFSPTQTALTINHQLRVRQANDSLFHSVSYCIGHRLNADYEICLDEERAQCDLRAFFHAMGQVRQDMRACVIHHAAHGTSVQQFNSIADDHGHVAVDSRVIVQPSAQKTQSQQSSKNLLLSSQATINVQPDMEIYHDEVNCRHGATVGDLDTAMLDYLRTRGIPLTVARQLLMSACKNDVLMHIKSAVARDYLLNINKDAFMQEWA